MKNKDVNIDLQSITKALTDTFKRLRNYQLILFFVAIASLYGYIVWRINVYSSVQPDATEVSSQTVKQPRINKNVADKMQQLEDNSVSVKALFDQARNNPFSE